MQTDLVFHATVISSNKRSIFKLFTFSNAMLHSFYRVLTCGFGVRLTELRNWENTEII